MTIKYCLHHKDYDTGIEEYVRLTARTDRGARIQAKKIIHDTDSPFTKIYFYRPSDGCEGYIDL